MWLLAASEMAVDSILRAHNRLGSHAYGDPGLRHQIRAELGTQLHKEGVLQVDPGAHLRWLTDTLNHFRYRNLGHQVKVSDLDRAQSMTQWLVDSAQYAWKQRRR
jgi:hypothetical protein